jgi:hypothetical protein
MRKYISIILLLCSFATPVHALDPITLASALGYSLTLHGGVAGLVSYFSKPTGNVKPTSTGGAALEASAVWVELVDLQPVGKTSAAVSTIDYSALRDSVLSAGVSSPLFTSFYNSTYVNPTINASTPVGTTIALSNGSYVKTTTSVNPMYVVSFGTFPNCASFSSATDSFTPSNPSVSCSGTYYTYTTDSTSAPTNITPTQVPVETAIAEMVQQQNDANKQAAANQQMRDAVVAASAPAIKSNCGGTFWTDSSTVNLTACGSATTPSNAVTPAEQTLAATAVTDRNNFNTAANNYANSQTSANVTTLNGARDKYNGTASALNTSLASHGAAPAATYISGTTTTPISSTTPTTDPLTDPNLTTPTVGPDNVYSPLGDSDKPALKSISNLLTGFIASAPLVTMVKTFVISTNNSSGVVPIGTVYGQQMSFDFTRWENTFRMMGGVLLVIVHGFAILVVVRGW